MKKYHKEMKDSMIAVGFGNCEMIGSVDFVPDAVSVNFLTMEAIG